MKKIILLLVLVFIMTSCGGNAIDRTIDLYEDATEHILQVKNREELRKAEREFDADYSQLLRECSDELDELKQKATDGDEKLLLQIKKANEAKRIYRNTVIKMDKEIGEK